MADQSKKGKSDKRLSEDERLKYIGFEVFPGKVKDLFKNENEKKLLEENVVARRAKGEILREDCTLLVERVSMGERILLTVASVMVIAAVFFPFYAAYTEIEIVDKPAVTSPPVESAIVEDTAGATDSALGAADIETTDTVAADSGLLAAVTGETDGTNLGDTEQAAAPAYNVEIDDKGNEIITGHIARKRYRKEFVRLSGIGSFLSLGTVGSALFSSGFVLMLTAVIFLLYTLACLAIPGLTLYAIYGSGAKGDALALTIKKSLKMSWWPVALFVVSIIISFFGAEYGFSTTDTFTSIGSSFGTGVLFDSLSYGIAISLGGFIILAAKGSEI